MMTTFSVATTRAPHVFQLVGVFLVTAKQQSGALLGTVKTIGLVDAACFKERNPCQGERGQRKARSGDRVPCGRIGFKYRPPLA
jgi:hypothetical protein